MDKQEIRQSPRKRTKLVSWIKNILNATEAKIALKTALAASLSLLVGVSYTKFLNRPDTLVTGLWCVMASIVVMQANLGGTYKAAWVRFLGVLIGSIAGAIFIDVIGSGPMSLGVSVFLTIVLCSLLNIKDSFRIAALSAALIIIWGGLKTDLNPWLFSFYRFLDSLIGILIALVVARSIWPEKAIENLRENMSQTLSLLNKYFRMAVDLEPETPGHTDLSFSLLGEIISLLDENREYRNEADIELFDEPVMREHWTLITDQLETVFESVDNLKHVHKDTISKIIDDGLSNQLNNFIDKVDLAFQTLRQLVHSENTTTNLSALSQSILDLNAELLRFRGTRITRKFSLEDVESFFVFFYSLRTIAEALIKMEAQLRQLSKIN